MKHNAVDKDGQLGLEEKEALALAWLWLSIPGIRVTLPMSKDDKVGRLPGRLAPDIWATKNRQVLSRPYCH